MKKLSLLISLLIFVLLSACQVNEKKYTPQVNSESETENPHSEVTNTSDTSINKNEISQGEQKEIINDSLRIKKIKKSQSQGKEAPVHNSPDQQVIDSIKQSKKKL
jgi:hypothetical protein